MTDDKKMVKVNDLREGKYDVTVTNGPSFSTQRQEAAEVYMQLTQQMPEIMSVAGDLIFKSMDLPYADQMAERMQTLLPPQIQEMINSDTEVPPEVQAMMAQAEQAMAAVEERAALVAEAEQELTGAKEQAASEAHQVKLNQKDVEIRIERLRRVKAEFDTHVAREIANVDKMSADMTAAGQAGSGEADPAMIALATAMKSMDGTMAGFMQETDTMFTELNRIANRKVQSSKPVREGGKLFTEVQYDDGESHRVEMQNPDD